eukprot:CAMPEP_0119400088 /NCGR_PEP_ID=MMETSP1334-20130426/141688_1 /TAXON_ID=127549 /ORGANISM="Calcidiscus leptoporus, Strain RCC1130" /LENGTH=39 /DNA_ID= /DNA_START= /DNA_END= /DNA_ORIENTATION=
MLREVAGVALEDKHGACGQNEREGRREHARAGDADRSAE